MKNNHDEHTWAEIRKETFLKNERGDRMRDRMRRPHEATAWGDHVVVFRKANLSKEFSLTLHVSLHMFFFHNAEKADLVEKVQITVFS